LDNGAIKCPEYIPLYTHDTEAFPLRRRVAFVNKDIAETTQGEAEESVTPNKLEPLYNVSVA
jgi:hypothetical protein